MAETRGDTDRSAVGLLASLVVPQFTNAGGSAMETAVKTDLRRVRGQLELYHSKHNGRYPNTIEMLVFDGYLKMVPTHSGPGEYQYDSDEGLFWSTQNLDW